MINLIDDTIMPNSRDGWATSADREKVRFTESDRLSTARQLCKKYTQKQVTLSGIWEYNLKI